MCTDYTTHTALHENSTQTEHGAIHVLRSPVALQPVQVHESYGSNGWFTYVFYALVFLNRCYLDVKCMRRSGGRILAKLLRRHPQQGTNGATFMG